MARLGLGIVAIAACGFLAHPAAAPRLRAKHAIGYAIRTIPSVPVFRLVTTEGEAAHFKVDDVGEFDLVPAASGDAGDHVTTAIFEIANGKRTQIGSAVVPTNGDEISTKTKPSFGLSIFRYREVK